MHPDDIQKTAPMRASTKSEGWREREEAKAAGVTPRRRRRANDEREAFVRC